MASRSCGLSAHNQCRTVELQLLYETHLFLSPLNTCHIILIYFSQLSTACKIKTECQMILDLSNMQGDVALHSSWEFTFEASICPLPVPLVQAGLLPADIWRGWGTPWAGYQSITGPHIEINNALTHTSIHLESPVTLCAYFWCMNNPERTYNKLT